MNRKIAAVMLLTLCVLAGATVTRGESRPSGSGAAGAAPRTSPASPVAAGVHAPLPVAAIDTVIRAEWKKEGVVPAPPVDDARYLRRIYLDIAGTIPPAETVAVFLADRSPDKRARAVETLLNSPLYGDNWTNYWDNVLMGRTVRAAALDRVAWREWLRSQFARNAPWNKVVYDLITATGVNSTGGSYAKVVGLKAPADTAMQMPADDGSGVGGGSARVNGAVNWILKYQQNYADLAGQASKIFLGVQIQCAQCHDHKTEKWKQDDFRRFTACFVMARPRPVSRPEKGMIRQVDVEDVNAPRRFRPGPKQNDNTAYLAAAPAALDGTDFSDSPNRRQALAQWMIAPENPWFAEAIVNRMWAHFLGRGFIEPIDDFRPSNPAVLPDLLKRLADAFIASGYDLKHLVKTICATQVYQLSSQPARRADAENKLWARYRLKPMGPEQLLDSLVTATNLQPVLERIAGDKLDGLKFAIMRQFTFLFDVDEEFEQKDFEGTIPQALMLLNGNLTNRSVTPIPGTALADVLRLPGGDAPKIEALYLRTVSRRPTPTEVATWTRFVNAPRSAILNEEGTLPPALQGGKRQLQGAGRKQMRAGGGPDPLARFGNRMNLAATSPKEQAYEDLFWALLNSSEFAFNH